MGITSAPINDDEDVLDVDDDIRIMLPFSVEQPGYSLYNRDQRSLRHRGGSALADKGIIAQKLIAISYLSNLLIIFILHCHQECFYAKAFPYTF